MFYTVKRPLVTEKNSLLMERENTYVFEVARESTKTDVKAAIERFFNVKVVSVRTAVCRGRGRRTRFGVAKPTYWKKAMVKLAPGEKITVFEGA